MPGPDSRQSQQKDVDDSDDGNVCNVGRKQWAVKREKHKSSACSVALQWHIESSRVKSSMEPESRMVISNNWV